MKPDLLNLLSFAAPLALTLGAPAADAQDDQERRLRALEDSFEALAEDIESMRLGDIMPGADSSTRGLGPAASKVYSTAQGLSIGGYGEARYQGFSGVEDDRFDFYRNVLYFGYKFDDQWIVNTEIELEHVEESFVEFAYLEYLHSEELSLRGGLMLSPMGIVNEYHEPTTFLTANRSMTETFLIPTTWRENGLGVLGSSGDVDYKLYVMNGMNGAGFDGSKGLRGGRQKGAEALANDFAVMASIDWTGVPGLMLGLSGYSGDSGQGGEQGDMGTDILEAHVDYRSGVFWGRALVAEATVDDRSDGDLDLGGWYVEAGYDLLSASEDQALYPYLRIENLAIDEAGERTRDEETTTLGLHYRPISQVVLKLDFTESDQSSDVTTFLIGYIF